MVLLQVTCLLIVALYLWFCLRREPHPARFFRRMGFLFLASLLGEDSMIRCYGFYAYSPEWSLFVDQVPLLIAIIWPVVIHSAWTLSRRLLGEGHALIPLLGGAIVLADASLIEPIAVQAGLWWWTEPGVFSVPPIGILGWAFFATAVIAFWERGQERSLYDAGVLVAPLVTHLLLLASWWGALRWVNRPIPDWSAVFLIWGVLLPLALFSWRERLRQRVPLEELLVRVPGAIFFFVLLALYGRTLPALICYALAFVPPYLSLLSFRAGGKGDIEESFEAEEV